MSATDRNGEDAGQPGREPAPGDDWYVDLARNIPGMTYRGTSSWGVEFISRCEDLCGYGAGEFLAGTRDWLDVIHPDDRDRVREQARILQSDPGRLVQEYRIVTRDGDTRWVEDHKTPRFSGDGEYRGVDGVVFDITDRMRLERDILRAGSRERQSISQTLHDSLGQKLTGIAFLARSLELELASQSLPTAQDAARLTELVKTAIVETRRITVGLAPVDMDPGSLSLALERLAEWTTDLCGIPCSLVTRAEAPVYDSDVALHLYHVAQEAVNNAVRHAEASKISLELAVNDGKGALVVTDNGKGLSGEAGEGGGMGLHTMRYRARILGGTLDLATPEEGGTSVTCSFDNRRPDPPAEDPADA